MNTYNGLPLYEIEFDDETSVFSCVSFVTEPAIQVGYIRLGKQDDTAIRLKVDKERRIVSGPVLIPGQPIYRNMEGRKFYITWSADTIKQVAVNFFQHNRQTEGNIEHSMKFNGVTFFESYITNRERGLDPKEFDVPSGTWFMSAQVDDEETWRLILDGTLTGFSIDMDNVRFKEDKPLSTLEEFLDYINK